jgi:hypothetical protein
VSPRQPRRAFATTRAARRGARTAAGVALKYAAARTASPRAASSGTSRRSIRSIAPLTSASDRKP